MSIEAVREHLKKYGAEHRIKEFDVSSATVELAAKALGCEPCQIAKSMAFAFRDSAILVIAAGDVKIDNSKFKAEFNTKAKMLSFDMVEELIGHAVGGVCPFGIKEGVKVYLDVSLKRFENVYPACGSSNSAIKLALEELEQFSKYEKWVDVCKNAQPTE